MKPLVQMPSVTDEGNVAQKIQVTCPRSHRTHTRIQRAQSSLLSTSHVVPGTPKVLSFMSPHISGFLGIRKRGENPSFITLPITITLHWIVRGARKNSYLQ